MKVLYFFYIYIIDFFNGYSFSDQPFSRLRYQCFSTKGEKWEITGVFL